MKKVAVVGDFILDKYNYGEIYGTCPEAPIPMYEKQTTECRLGGAGKCSLYIIAHHEKKTLRSLSLSYPKKDWQAGALPILCASHTPIGC